jgi:hypothetical protein
MIILSLKLSKDIGNWKWEDTQEFVGLANRRARWFFDARTRIPKHIAILQQYYDETGGQPDELSPKERKELTRHVEYSWFEQVMMAPWFFNSALGFVLIVCGLIAANSQS